MISSELEYEIKLNDEPLKALIGFTVVEKLEEPLDEGAFEIPITVFDYESEMLGILEIVLKDTSTNKERKYQFLIGDDTVETISKEGIYSHVVTVVEYTYYYDLFLVKALTFTQMKNENREPIFKINTFPYDSSSTGYESKFVIPKIKFKQYYSQGLHFIEQVEQGYLVLPKRADVYIRTYSPQNVTAIDSRYFIPSGVHSQEVFPSQSNNFLNFDEYGVWVIEYGFVDYQVDPLQAVQERQAVFFYTVFVNRQERTTLYDYIERLRGVIPLETRVYHERTRLFNIKPELVSYFKSVKMPQMFITDQTVRQFLNHLFKYINSIFRLEYIKDNLDNIDITRFNQISGSFTKTKMTDFKTNQSLQGYGTEIVSYLQNSLQENFLNNPSIKTPANNYYKTVRASNIQLTNTQGGFKIPLPRNIYMMTKFTAIIPKLDIVKNGSIDETLEYFELDLTTRMLNKREWDLKQVTNNFPSAYVIEPFEEDSLGFIGLRENKISSLYYEQNKSDITSVSEVFGTTFEETLLINTLKEALNEYFTQNQIGLYVGGDLIRTVVGYNVTDITSNTFYRNIGFNIEYISLDTPIVKTHRPDLSVINRQSIIKQNQSDRVVDFNLATRNAKGSIMRSGVPNQTFSLIHRNTNDMFSLGNVDKNGYVITKISTKLYNEHIEATYEITKDHIRLSEFMGINQQYRIFEIPRDNVYDRNDTYEDFMIIDKLGSQLFKEQVLYNDTFLLKTFKHLLVKDKTQDKISFAMIRTDGMLSSLADKIGERYAVMVEINSFGGEQGLVFNFGFQNNIVAGDMIKKVGSNFYNMPVKYTDDLGDFEELWFAMASDFVEEIPTPIGGAGETIFNKTYQYPLFVSDQEDLSQDFDIQTGSIVGGQYNPIVYLKDRSERLKTFNYQVTVLPLNYKVYVLGNAFFTENRTVFNPSQDNKVFLYKYKDDTKYDDLENLFVKITGTSYDMVELNLEDGTRTINYEINALGLTVTFSGNAEITSIYKGWAIGNEFGDLLIACNEPINGFVVRQRHFRPNVKYHFPTENAYFIGGADPEQLTIIDSASGFKSDDFGGSVEFEVNYQIQSLGSPSDDFGGSASDTLGTITDTASGYMSDDFAGTATFEVGYQISMSGYATDDYAGSANDTIAFIDGASGVKSDDIGGALQHELNYQMTVTAYPSDDDGSSITHKLGYSISLVGLSSDEYGGSVVDSIAFTDSASGYATQPQQATAWVEVTYSDWSNASDNGSLELPRRRNCPTITSSNAGNPTNYIVDFVMEVIATRLCDSVEPCPAQGYVSCGRKYYKAV